MPSTTRRFQFSLRTLLVMVAAIALVLALMYQIPLEAARPTLVLLIPIASALAITGLVYGQATTRTFCIGTLVPLGVMLVYGTAISARTGFYQLFVGDQRAYFGGALLFAIALGNLCVAFRWLIVSENPASSDHRPTIAVRRPQFTLRALLVLMLAVACFCGGMAVQRRLDRPIYEKRNSNNALYLPDDGENEWMTMPDGTIWLRLEQAE